MSSSSLWHEGAASVVLLPGGEDGLKCYRQIAEDINRVIGKNGRVVLEIGYNQAEDVIKIFESKFSHHLDVSAKTI